MNDKQTFWEWAAQDMDCPMDEVKEFVRDALFSGRQIHLGDCTKHPAPCFLCQVESLLSAYRIYYFDNRREAVEM